LSGGIISWAAQAYCSSSQGDLSPAPSARPASTQPTTTNETDRQTDSKHALAAAAHDNGHWSGNTVPSKTLDPDELPHTASTTVTAR